MKAAMLLFPGSNCDLETLAYLKRTYGEKNVSRLWHRDRFDPKAYDLIFLPGGFSYGDYLRAGACAAQSPAMQDVIAHAQRGGYVVGVCNGFQILLETRLLPGTLIRNDSGAFECRWVDIGVSAKSKLGWKVSEKKQIRLPIANTFGRYYLPPNLELESEDQVVLKYADTGEVAGISNVKGNVLGMMPHPERAAFKWHDTQDGCGFLPPSS